MSTDDWVYASDILLRKRGTYCQGYQGFAKMYLELLELLLELLLQLLLQLLLLLLLLSCLLYTSPSPRDLSTSRMPSSA